MCRLSVCVSLSVTFCIVAKWYVLAKNCLKERIGNQVVCWLGVQGHAVQGHAVQGHAVQGHVCWLRVQGHAVQSYAVQAHAGQMYNLSTD